MTIQRHFLGFERPALAATVDFLVERYAADGQLDLSGVVLVPAAGRAGRRLQELLVERAARERLRFWPPQVVTPGGLPELFYEPQRRFADDLTQRLAWVAALRAIGSESLREVFSQLPAEDDAARWLPPAAALSRLHRELAAEGLDFADVIEGGTKLEGFAETQRWRTLLTVQRKYLELLDNQQLWDTQTARLVAIRQRECRIDRDVLLVAAADMNRSLRQMLDHIAPRVTALIHAPPESADRFDPYGCLLPEVWQELPLPVTDEQIVVAGRPADQAEAAARAIAGYAGGYAAADIAIGVPQEGLVPHLSRKLDEYGLATRWVTGRTLEQTGPYRLLQALADWLGGESLVALAALLRHPDLHDRLLHRKVEAGGLEELDRYRSNHLQSRLGREWLGEPRKTNRLREAVRQIRQWVRPLTAAAGDLPALAAGTRQVLLEVYGDREFSAAPEDHFLQESLRRLDGALDCLELVPPALRPEVDVPQFLRLVLDEIRDEPIASPVDPDAIQMLGWLELPLDESPALIVTGFNEGHVPESVNADPFLPNRLRQALNLLDNRRRLARDAYALEVLSKTRERLTLIVGKFDPAGDPLAPSRLLFHCDAETAARRALRLFGEPATLPDRPPAGRLPPPRAESEFRVPLPRPAEPLQALAVTAFRDYLNCPYRFYLRQVLRLGPETDDAREIDPAGFGSLLHDVLRMFGESEVRHQAQEEPIAGFLNAALDALVEERFGRHPLSAVAIQAAQARARLEAFARWQADWASQGWRIEHSEWNSDPERSVLEVDGRTFGLKGRVDRIDRHEQTGEWFVFDYKTGNSADSPEKAHHRSNGWIDLQLPLYRHVVRPLEIDEPRLGYIVLPRKLSDVGLKQAEWVPAQLAEADETAREVVRSIWDQRFWPPREVQAERDDFAAICQSTVYDRRWEGELQPGSEPPDVSEEEE